MPDLNKVNTEFFKPYLTVLNFFRYTGINIFNETNIAMFKFKYLHIITFIIFILMSISHWSFMFQKLFDGADLLYFSVELSYSYSCIQGLFLFLDMCIIKSRVQKFVFKLEKQWRADSSLLPHLVSFKRKQIGDYDRLNYIILKSIEIYRLGYMGYPLLVTLVQKYILKKEAVFTTSLGFTMPFEFKDKTFKFLCIYFIEYINVMILTTILNPSLLLLAVTMNQLKILFELLHADFKELMQSKEENIDIKMKRTVQRHSILTGLLSEFGAAFGAFFAIHQFFLGVTVCFYGIAAIINKRLEDLKNLLICILTSGISFYCCLCGQNVTDTAQDVANAIYQSSWEDLSIKNKKIILFTILRSQKTSYIKSTYFTKMSLDSFIMIMKMTWSLMSLITTVYQKK